MKKLVIILACSLFTICTNAQIPEQSQLKLDSLIIKRNDNRFFEAEYDLTNTLKFKEVSTISDSSKTVSINLTFNSGSGTMLKIYNPFSEQLTYKAELYSYKKKDYIETSTVPVFSKISFLKRGLTKLTRFGLRDLN